MSFNLKRRLRRTAMRGEGWRSDSPKSGRKRGALRVDAERSVAVVSAALDARAKR